MQNKKVRVKKLVEYFDFKVICGDDDSLRREILVADINRPGLELTGYFKYSQKERIIALGDKEIAYIDNMEETKQREVFNFLTSEETPAIIITKNHECPKILKEIGCAKNFPILSTDLSTSRTIINTVSFLDEFLAKSTSLHGVLMSIFGKGVLIKGESGSGKSEVALDLIKKGHQLIADDLVDCYQVHNHIIGKPPKILKGFLELRGIGVVNVNKMFGAIATLPRQNIDFVIELQQWDSSFEYDRIGIGHAKHEKILDCEIPKIILPIRGGRSMANLIESAVSNMALKEYGYDAALDFENRCIELMKDGEE